ncbi:MAG: hypothetical protein ACOCVM_05285 [Desulfovibrionaceae bacterium]
MSKIIVYIEAPGHPGWRELLRRGVHVPVARAMGMNVFLTEALGLSPGYVQDEVRTIFLNAHPVDDLGGAVVCGGDVVGLGAAMPGMVGITMRRESPLAVFREDISSKETDGGSQSGGRVLVKLFNTVARDAAATVLSRGVSAPAASVLRILSDQCAPECIVEVEGASAGRRALQRDAEQGADVLLAAKLQGES